MLEDVLFWVGMLGFSCGLMVGISLLESESSLVRNIMFAVGIAVIMFGFLLTMKKNQSSEDGAIIFLIVSFLIGAVACVIVAFAAHGNLRAAALAGGIAGITIVLMSTFLPPGSFGYSGIDDIPTAIDFIVTMLVGGLIYYLLRNWGKREEKWD